VLARVGRLSLLVALIALVTPGRANPSSTKSFYLTKDSFNGANALTACAKGYHMASLWEIFDPSNLTYNTNLGFTHDDSGSGPPAFVNADLGSGWIRTGHSAATVPFTDPGTVNCVTWKSNSPSDIGTVVWLPLDWSASPTAIAPWRAGISSCDFSIQVWCVSD
jgi:hypothetical protein